MHPSHREVLPLPLWKPRLQPPTAPPSADTHPPDLPLTLHAPLPGR